MMEANSQYDVLYITQEEFGQIKNENHQNVGAPFSIDPTTIIFQVELVKECARSIGHLLFKFCVYVPLLSNTISF